MRRHHANGFTLLELAIVIVIIALVMGGIMMASEVITNAKLRAVMTEVDDLRKAVSQFSGKYHGLPGDLYNATSLWGLDGSGNPVPDNNCPTTPSSYNYRKINTCDGDGNNQITDYETHRAWQHLADSGFIKGMYSGVQTTNGVNDSSTLGINIPASSKDAVGYYLFYHNTTNAFITKPVPGGWGAPAGHYIDIATLAADLTPTAPAFSPSEALSIDIKMDDGMPGQGTVQATPNGGGCTTSPKAYVASTSITPKCMLSVAVGVE